MTTFKVAVLGAQGVGKSAIVRQFLYNEFSEVCVPTKTRRVYLPAVVMNGHVHDLQIMDFPPITAFPVNTLQVGLPRLLRPAEDGSAWRGQQRTAHCLPSPSPVGARPDP